MMKLDFELVYLILLTRERVKPLSRWEKEFTDKEIGFVRDMGLKTEVVERTLRTGERIEELVFSKERDSIDFYIQKFMRTSLNKTPETIRIEGELFGYPECCVEYWIREGYTKNGLAPEDQRILFHRACPGCKVTPILLPKYRKIYKKAKKLHTKMVYVPGLPFSLRKGVAMAGLLSFLSVGFATTPDVNPFPLQLKDLHRLPIENDGDKDFLDDSIEHLFNLDPNNPDTNHNNILDGVELSKRMWVIIRHLPTAEIADRPYLIDHQQRGLTRCDICGKDVNMGYAEIINPILNLSIQIPYIGLHYMRHGSFKYQGDRGVDAELLGRILDLVK